MGPRKHPSNTAGLAPRPPSIPPIWAVPTNTIPATIPCPACGAPAAVSAIEDRRAPPGCIIYLTARCACGVRLDAVGVNKDGDLPRTERVALDDLRAVYRQRQANIKKGA